MARVKGAMNARKKHKKVLKLAKGYRGSRSKLYRPEIGRASCRERVCQYV